MATSYLSEIEAGDGSRHKVRDSEAIHTNELLDKVYPVGSIYLSTSSVNPGTIFGGTWELWGKGRVLVGVDPNDSDYDAVGKTGGAKRQTYTPKGSNTGGAVQAHALTEAQMPWHKHTYRTVVIDKYTSAQPNPAGSPYVLAVEALKDYPGYSSDHTGGGESHTHGFTQPKFVGNSATLSCMQPYITCYMWRRKSG